MLVMVSLAFHLFVGSYLCAFMAATNVVIVVVHSFVADSSLLDCCDLVLFFFPHLMFAGRPPFAFLMWF